MTLRALVIALVSLAATPAWAANVLVMSNNNAAGVAADFGAQTSHTYTSWDANATPTLDQLLAYDAVLLFENGIFGNAVNIGEVVADYAEQGGGVVTATFFLQDFSNAGFGGTWGALEAYDPLEPAGGGCEYNADDLDAASIVDHPITEGVAQIHANSYRGGAVAKADATVLALWATPNPLGSPDPVVAFRQQGNACVVGITIFPDASFGDFSGDVYLLFDNALEFATSCVAVGSCGNGMLDMGEQCDDGNGSNNDACVAGCVSATCGDGYTYAGVEACDDGDDDNGDACLVGCVAASCGDGFIQAGVEGCDDGNGSNADACVGSCQLASCGDGYVFAGFEGCDDGNDIDGDGCTGCELDPMMTTDATETTDPTDATDPTDGGSSEAGSSDAGTATSAGDESTGGGADDSTGGADGASTPTGSSASASGGDESASDGETDATTGGTGDPGAASFGTNDGTGNVPRGNLDGCACSADGGNAGGVAWYMVAGVLGLHRRRRR